ncbi:hypothetical protein DIS03_17585 [Vibrio cholerae]|uniref:hypothetical protein n=1 Tax=Vibrio cholerae TaxID=666 RepID=UPI0004D3F186|nr:hypothetical protein CD57_14515 [Vibrio cholerae O1 biovar El Tor]MRI12330.1 hypothetical protein [Vibrio cholerae]GHW87700.1 hypothetical protein VCSRO154_3246 [Vibrio metoecus]KOY96005.1 hypothetical protein AM627_15815 [Vibrio cholerae O1 biovar El Tor]KOY97224.1 hypothetical protein AM626_17295 [Vibrio cholerae O1 biovar El Tor]
MKITRLQREFIGEQFHTPKGGTLTVTGITDQTSGRNAVFTVECSICSVDEVLFPDGFTSTKSNLVCNERVPCPCSGRYKYSPNQYHILVQRNCAQKGYTLLEFGAESGEWFGAAKTPITLLNPKTGRTWTTTVYGFLNT